MNREHHLSASPYQDTTSRFDRPADRFGDCNVRILELIKGGYWRQNAAGQQRLAERLDVDAGEA